VYPKLDDLPEEFRRRWKEHEARREPPADSGDPSAGKAPAGGAR
jgi:hypothetical protein